MKVNQIYGFNKNGNISVETRSSIPGTRSMLFYIENLKDNKIGAYLSNYNDAVPVGLILRACKIIGEKSIRELIGIKSHKVELYINNIIRENGIAKTQKQAIELLSNILPNNIPDKYEQMIEILSIEFLPHLGPIPQKKGIYVCMMIKKCLKMIIDSNIPDDDRDNFSNKRIDAAGQLLGELMKGLISKYAQAIAKSLEKQNDLLIIMAKQRSITKGIKYSMATGNWGSVKKSLESRKGVSQILVRLSWLSAVSYLRRVVTPVGKEGKSLKLRGLHQSHWGYICPYDSPEGKPCGIVKNFTFLAKMSVESSKARLHDLIIIMIVNIIGLDNYEFITINVGVFINDDIIGYIEKEKANNFVKELKDMRDKNIIHEDVSVAYNFVEGQIKIYCDGGRIMRPLFCVKDGKILINNESILKGWNYCVREKLIKYIDNNEEEWSLVSSIEELNERKNVEYCEIVDYGIFSTAAATVHMTDKSQAPRNSYSCLDPNTEIRMCNGSLMKIKDIKVGHRVISLNTKTGEQVVGTVNKVFTKPVDRDVIKITTLSGRELICTIDHKLYTSGKWIEAKDAKDICITKYEEEFFLDRSINIGEFYFDKIVSKTPHYTSHVSDISIASYYNFILENGMVVHNCNMNKQSQGTYTTNFKSRFDTQAHIMCYPQKQLVSTEFSKIIGHNDMSSGFNPIVAVMVYGGFGQEDAILLNEASLQRGMAMTITFKSLEICETKNGTNIERIELPDITTRKNGKNKSKNFNFLDAKGIVKRNSQVKEGDIIVGKVLIQNQKPNKDVSVSIKKGEEGTIDDIYIGRNSEGFTIIKIRIRQLRIPELGDKFSCNSQKGTTSLIIPECDMPFNHQGIRPDMIINPAYLPTRMTVNQPIVSLMSKSTCLTNNKYEATSFQKIDYTKIKDSLKNAGFNPLGEETLYSGITGEQMKAMIFMGPMFYQRLKHMAQDKIHSRTRGRVTMMTRQPVSGRANGGGLRFGEMERDCMISHGCSGILQDRMFTCSDKFVINVCKNCGVICENDICKLCNDNNIQRTNMPYACKLLFHELMSVGIKLKFDTSLV
jgi:DNA-directed RNA polymerase II subunit RPB2